MMFTDVRYASTEAHVCLNIVDDIPASGWRTDRLARGEAARIAVGAPLPSPSSGVDRDVVSGRSSMLNFQTMWNQMYRKAISNLLYNVGEKCSKSA
jgi:hypothetical protein